MGHVKEPLDVDFVVDPKPLTKEDQEAISDFIKADKLKRERLAKRRELLKVKSEKQQLR